MEMNDKPMNEMESIQIINSMIANAKQGMQSNGTSFILWGWALFATCLASFILYFIDYKQPMLPWTIATLFGIIMIGVNVMQKPKVEKVRTYMDELIKAFTSGFYICLVIVIAGMNFNAISSYAGFIVLLLLYGLLMHVVGFATRYKPLIVGAIVAWTGCLLGLWLQSMMYLMLFTAISMVMGFIVPGHLLRKAYKNNQY
ncbi:hypothetical protein LX64_03040 [Chitinophaga skermanii]|uniref:Uncharacterized protein n=1 Tax=Chitinophaga skermanii TaxID=331697 RepID=A0A327QKD1_9BACT|nr:hypothetical protein [Chitinophaga skermanii]RAJ04162.1 hypothetical protein LX64_03040 [Chitinophaga skermanii]